MSYTSDLDPALIALVDRVAERQRQDFGQTAAAKKADGSLITSCDRWSDATLVEGLGNLYPSDGVLSEEGQQYVPDSEAYWVVDPLDGTTNFAAGIPYWAISIARIKAGQPVMAILDVPPLHQRIVAMRGHGVWRNGKVIQAPFSHSSIGGCVSLCSRSIHLLRMVPKERFPGKIRMLGVASLNMVSVGMGQTVAALEAAPKIWDLAAAWLVLMELQCSLRWLVVTPEAIMPGTDLSSMNFPVLVADRDSSAELFMPWAQALITSTADGLQG